MADTRTLSAESCESAVKRIIAEQGRIDVLVNNAGMGGVGAMLDVDVESDKGAKATFETNVWAPIRLSKVVAPHMVEAGSGLIINIGSIVGASSRRRSLQGRVLFCTAVRLTSLLRALTGNIPTPWAGVYAASKAALHSMTETLRMEVEGFGIKVMLVAPGAITSNFGTKHKESLTLPDGAPGPLPCCARLLLDLSLITTSGRSQTRSTSRSKT